MVTIQDAYSKIFDGPYYGMESNVCLEMDNKYIFAPRPIGHKSNDKYFSGLYFPCVDKITGNISQISILSFIGKKVISHSLILD